MGPFSPESTCGNLPASTQFPRTFSLSSITFVPFLFSFRFLAHAIAFSFFFIRLVLPAIHIFCIDALLIGSSCRLMDVDWNFNT